MGFLWATATSSGLECFLSSPAQLPSLACVCLPCELLSSPLFTNISCCLQVSRAITQCRIAKYSQQASLQFPCSWEKIISTLPFATCLFCVGQLKSGTVSNFNAKALLSWSTPEALHEFLISQPSPQENSEILYKVWLEPVANRLHSIKVALPRRPQRSNPGRSAEFWMCCNLVLVTS